MLSYESGQWESGYFFVEVIKGYHKNTVFSIRHTIADPVREIPAFKPYESYESEQMVRDFWCNMRLEYLWNIDILMQYSIVYHTYNSKSKFEKKKFWLQKCKIHFKIYFVLKIAKSSVFVNLLKLWTRKNAKLHSYRSFINVLFFTVYTCICSNVAYTMSSRTTNRTTPHHNIEHEHTKEKTKQHHLLSYFTRAVCVRPSVLELLSCWWDLTATSRRSSRRAYLLHAAAACWSVRIQHQTVAVQLRSTIHHHIVTAT